ncbi:MAG: 2-phospho-L-lactate guanylyltransferase [Propionibacteriaceae bacterium]
MPVPDRIPAAGSVPASGAVVALKSLYQAKSRLVGIADPLRRRLAWTMAADTLESLVTVVHTVIVISDEPSLQGQLAAEGIDATVVPEASAGGMNTALEHGEQVLRRAGAEFVLACVADLPALRPATVEAVLTAAAEHPRSFVADATGIGTTMLLARGVALDPLFQGRSAAAHRASGAFALGRPEIGEASDARRDVDTVVDLYVASVLGLGPRTRRLIDPGTARLGTHQVITTAGPGQVITSTGVRLPLPDAALPSWFAALRPGQRLHAVLGEGQVLAAWL